MNEQILGHTRQGIAHAQQGRFAEAERSFEEAVRLDPNFAQGYGNLANIFLFQGRYDDAVANYRKTLEFLPRDVETLNNLSYAYSKQGNALEAEVCARQALQLRPNFPEAHNHLGIALGLQKRWDEAEPSYREALRLWPGFAKAHANLAQLLFLQARYDEAVVHGEEAVRIDPNQAEPHNTLSAAYLRLHKLDLALARTREAMRLNPQLPESYFNLANIHFEKGELADAVAVCEDVLRFKPDYVEVENILGGVALKEGRLEDALKSFDTFLRQRPEDAQGHFNRAMVLLHQGDFAEGFAEYEWRWKWKDFVVKPFLRPMWDGSSLAGKTILLHAEQGLGDTLQFIRYAPLVKELGASVIVACQQALLNVLSRSQGIDRLVPQDTFTEEADEHAPLLSLPSLLKTTLETIPASIPYLFADPDLAKRWRNELAVFPGFKVGIVWHGNLRHPDNRFRSIPLKMFASLAAVPDVRLYSLQVGPGTEELVEATFPVVPLGQRFQDFADTAAALEALDLVIAVDTAVAHLAGGLGVPVWVALPFASDWRWLKEREDSPWYPTMRLFRQRHRGDWPDVFERMASALAKEAGSFQKARATGAGLAIPIEISPGDLMDRITVLEAREAGSGHEDDIPAIARELQQLVAARDRFLRPSKRLDELTNELAAVNQELFNLKEKVRACEENSDLGTQLSKAARTLCQLDDRRHVLKRQIDELPT